MSQQSEMADLIYIRLGEGPVATAHLVRELRERWGAQHGISAVHGFIREVATCLLWRGDVDVGDFQDGRFVSWAIEPEDANDRIGEELMSMESFLIDESRQIFRKKKTTETNQCV
jgi:hypothetical protein